MEVHVELVETGGADHCGRHVEVFTRRRRAHAENRLENEIRDWVENVRCSSKTRV